MSEIILAEDQLEKMRIRPSLNMVEFTSHYRNAAFVEEPAVQDMLELEDGLMWVNYVILRYDRQSPACEHMDNPAKFERSIWDIMCMKPVDIDLFCINNEGFYTMLRGVITAFMRCTQGLKWSQYVSFMEAFYIQLDAISDRNKPQDITAALQMEEKRGKALTSNWELRPKIEELRKDLFPDEAEIHENLGLAIGTEAEKSLSSAWEERERRTRQ